MKKYNKILLSKQNVSEDDLQTLIQQLEENECEVILSELEEKIEQLGDDEEIFIIEEVEKCDIVFVLIGGTEEENECVKKEIEEADKQEKLVIGIYMGGNAQSVPPALEKFGSGLITNDIIKIMSVLQGNECPWEDVTGGPRKPTKKIDTSEC